MIKRVNSTGRKRIGASFIEINVHDEMSPRTFDATINLKDFDAPPEAAVVLEATCAGSNTIRRFSWGTVGQLTPPEDRSLADLHGANVFFSLKVIDHTERFGRILGLAENIRPLKGGPKTATGRRGILPVEKADLGDHLWKLDFRSEDVFLLVNQRIEGFADQVRFDPMIYSLIYPAIIRQILVRAFDEQTDDEEDTDRWSALWLKFAQRLHPEGHKAPSSDDDDEQEEWIDEVISAFCREHSLRDKFQQAVNSSGAWGNAS